MHSKCGRGLGANSQLRENNAPHVVASTQRRITGAVIPVLLRSQGLERVGPDS
jgi:hypothetical protein